MEIHLKSTPEEFVLIKATVDILWNHYESELKYFQAAFIHKHDLGIKSNKDNGLEETKNPLDFQKLLEYMHSVEFKAVNKQLMN